MLKRLSLAALVLGALSFASCEQDDAIEPELCTSACYLHLSHTRTDSNPFMDAVVEKLDYSTFDMLWLGGDLADETSEDDVTMTRVDSILHLGDANTLWALGNHDYADLNRVTRYTNRPPYYATHRNGITLVVLDTQDSLSNIVGDQQAFLQGVLDTLQASSHLVLLHHKLIWMYGDPFLEPQISSVSNGFLGDCFYCVNPNNFNTEIYPELVKVRSRGIEVICIGGDLGFQANEFQYLTPDGIHFLASGIDNTDAIKKALLFHHDVTNRTLRWEYKLLSEL